MVVVEFTIDATQQHRLTPSHRVGKDRVANTPSPLLPVICSSDPSSIVACLLPQLLVRMTQRRRGVQPDHHLRASLETVPERRLTGGTCAWSGALGI
jgi:hypothetical protein